MTGKQYLLYLLSYKLFCIVYVFCLCGYVCVCVCVNGRGWVCVRIDHLLDSTVLQRDSNLAILTLMMSVMLALCHRTLTLTGRL